MNLLLDTHIWLWLDNSPERLSKKIITILEHPENKLYLSSLSIWEIAIKVTLGKLEISTGVQELVKQWNHTYQAVSLPFLEEHAIGSGLLAPLHHDPFDRGMISQAQHERFKFVTSDANILKYNIDLIFAG